MAKLSPRHAVVDRDMCVACGTCVDVCPMGAMKIIQGVYASPVEDKCVGCGMCAKECPASAIKVEVRS
ncbi:Ferredoxin [Anaerovibrio sp. JC8]|uniref:4Fe-4S binding protein n=1 Tax=Anaerovibrio sp. JC8 TaxID=1240085 RepID=UPI000A0C9207|nr:4Fe-4S binding protein [Anaerovibrio sp. JC8]ORT99300.1 Ferredoxin [Anaerovibrio sp. JC8]